MRCRAIQQPCTFFLCEPTLLQHSFVRVQTRFAPCNTISYVCKHVLPLTIRLRTRAYTFYIVATTHSVVHMNCCALQQSIRWSEWAFLKGLRVGKDHFHVFGTHAVQQSAHLLLGILLCELQVLA